MKLQLLQEVFGYSSFRGAQEDIIQGLIDGESALVLMPTGGGKSLCYQLPAMIRSGLGVVVSPLIALMQDQVSALRELGVAAGFLNSSLSYEEQAWVLEEARFGKLDLLYVAPERLMTEDFLRFLEGIPLALFAIDEAHCVSQWGHDFRPEYIQLAVLAERFTEVPRVALTATADELTRKEIREKLALEDAKVFISSFDRSNIHYGILEKHQPRKQFLDFYHRKHQGDAGIVYCLSRKRVEETARYLQEQGIDALPYHAGLGQHLRSKNQDRFLKEDGVVMVATIAFGMGIDKPDVRFVVHLDLPKSIEAYYQETGRAGRDGLAASALLLYGLADLVQIKRMMLESQAPEHIKRIEQRKLDALLGLCEASHCRRKILLNYFGESYPEHCHNCDNCQHTPNMVDATIPAQKLLSCIARTGQRFGAAHLVDVLLGRETAKVKQWQHHRLSVFNIGKELQDKAWHSLLRQLLANGYVQPDVEGYGSLKLTKQSRDILQRTHSFHMRVNVMNQNASKQESQREEKKRHTREQKRLQDAFVLEGKDIERFESLRELRLELAKTQNVPPYVIFHDSTLREMLRVNPQSLEEMRQVTGVGEKKLEKYGQQFLDRLAV